MARYGIGFNKAGQFTTFPSLFTTINADNLDLRPQAPTGVLVLLGPGAGFFPPQVPTALPMDVGSPQRFLTASDLLTACNYAVPPFNQIQRGAGIIFVVPVTKATPSTKTLNTGASVLLATLTSKGWGLKFNGITVKSETGKVTLALPAASGTITESFSYSTIQDLVDQINARSGLVSAVFASEGTMATFTAVAMTGGTEPAVTSQDWADSLVSLNQIRVNVLCPVTSDASVWAQVNTYITQKRSRAVVGGATQNWNGVSARATAIIALKAQAAALNSPRMLHVGIGAEGLPAYTSTAPRVAALCAALDPSTPATFKHLDLTSLEAVLDIASEVGGVDGLLLAGIAPPVADPQALSTYILSRGLSTWTGDDNLYRREFSVLAAVDALQDLLEARLRNFLGGEGTLDVLERVVKATDQVLHEATRPTASVRIVSYRPESIVATFSGTILRVTASLTPILPINFIDLTLNLENTDITVQFDVNLASAA
jgi:hypothetical protein